jgi:tetratricopeptide (TPR) repeat protein
MTVTKELHPGRGDVVVRTTRQGDGLIAGLEGADPGESSVDYGFTRNPVRFAMLAVFHCAGKAADKIISLYNNTFRLDRDYVAAFSKSTGIAHASRGRWRQAIPVLEKALAMAPDDHEPRMHLAEAYAATNQHSKAHEQLKKALAANPDSARVAYALGVLCSNRQEYERAVKYLKMAVELDPGHVESLYRLGTAYDNKKLYDKAIESFKGAICLDPRFVKAYQALGFTYESIDDRKSAVECFKKALELE